MKKLFLIGAIVLLFLSGGVLLVVQQHQKKRCLTDSNTRKLKTENRGKRYGRYNSFFTPRKPGIHSRT